MKKFIYLILIILIIIFIIIYLINENSSLKITYHEIIDNQIPINFNNFKIAQISDFHNTKSHKLNSSLIKNLEKEKPNIILITGDFIDSRKTDINTAIKFLKKIINIAPIYYVPGNHESRTNKYNELKSELTNLNIKILENKIITLSSNGDNIDLIGINDPKFFHKNDEIATNLFLDELNNLSSKSTNYNILLSHRPEFFTSYVKNKFNLIFTGHAHGGQINIPFIGGIFVPNQGFFSKYIDGLHKDNETSMIISRGIGNSLFPFRINNNPELIVATLKNK